MRKTHKKFWEGLMTPSSLKVLQSVRLARTYLNNKQVLVALMVGDNLLECDFGPYR
jgi:hypothetical protein